MSRAHWSQVDELFYAALEREPAERMAFLAEACRGDASLRSEVEALLSADDRAGSFLERGLQRAPTTLEPGQVLGSYRIEGLIGRGGMGEVYRARDSRLSREVAIKVLPRPSVPRLIPERPKTAGAVDATARVAPVRQTAGLESASEAHPPAFDEADALRELLGHDSLRLRRFEREALLTATVQHPAVVPIYERGELPDGRPFYAMKLVSGRSLHELIDERKTLADRIALLPYVIAVAEALGHAHWQKIVHRDVKPSNIIVGEFGETLLIDWGLAKSVVSDTDESPSVGLASGSERTSLGEIIGTPAYMSPEQAMGMPVDERSDVFSLGATLYQVLTGRAPYQGDTPSILLNVKRGGYPPLSTEEPQVPGELAAIVSKAMAPDPAQRYRSARELAEDLVRFQTGQLVLSHHYSAPELVRRWAKRHRALLVASAAFLAVAIAGGAIGVRRIVAERDRANRQAEASQRVSQFMTDMFKISDPTEARGNKVTAREILDKASKQIESGLSKDPEVQAQLMDTMVQAYKELGLWATARPLAEKAVEVRQKLHGLEDPETLRSMNALANIDLLQGKRAEAESRYRQVLEIQRRVLGPQHKDTLTSVMNLAVTDHRQGHYASAEKLYREGLEIGRRVWGPEHAKTLQTMTNLGVALQDQGKYAAADKLFREVLAIKARLVPNDQDLFTLQALAANEFGLGHYDEAERRWSELIETARQRLGPEHALTIRSISYLGNTYLAMKRLDDAERVLAEALETSQRALGPEHPNTLVRIKDLAEAKSALGQHTEAEKLLLEGIATQRRVLGPDHPQTLQAMTDLANVEARQGRYAESEKLQLETLAAARGAIGASSPLVAQCLYHLASLSGRQGDRKKALGYLRQAIDSGLNPGELRRMGEDDDLKSLRGDPEFEAIVREAKSRPSAS